MARGRKWKFNNGTGDRISDLPDSILHHILSYVDIRCAVQTCILSSRWRHVWKSSSHLCFPWRKNWNLGTIVNKVLNLRDQNTDIVSFRVISVDNRDVPLAYSWILAAIARNVQEIDIDIRTKYTIVVPPSLFTCRSITVLKLSLGKNDETNQLIFPDLIDLPNLKVLHFREMSFKGLKGLNEIANFISSCSNLESLKISGVCLTLLGTLVICAPKLEKFVIQNQVFGKWHGLDKCKLKILAPSLRTFYCHAFMATEFLFGDDVPHRHLKCAYINLGIEQVTDGYKPLKDLDLPEQEKQEYVQRMTRLLETVRSVEYLTLSARLLVVAFQPPAVLKSLSLQFHNLKYLDVQTWLSGDCVLAIIHLLKISPKIEKVIIEIIKNDSSLQPCHRCLDKAVFHRLKVVDIHGLFGLVNEFKLLEIVLKNARVLEKMVIWTDTKNPPYRAARKMNFHKKLLTVPQASSKIDILFF